ncbi:1-deoxy-D-xylulose-5-phosphate reductoisomerase [Galactobacter caseinivorans]|uniref:1-deoxy-D-xylulose 5-phosphate reductoisomerase n=1 Tax=Galactobacter caseinivorans TaxID=2676123 RepID=A0A496PK61_9MICC|nr:1-deoxy-D-xylulose-5-phosphate reductoisomerase [Galactobacter caseinivorans]
MPPTDRPRRIVVLGSTGSIGTQALDIIRRNPHLFEVTALAAGSNARELARQALAFQVPVVALAGADGMSQGDVEGGLRLHLAGAREEALERGQLDLDDVGLVAVDTDDAQAYEPTLLAGPDAATQAAALEHADVVLNGITGSIGLAPTLAALDAGHLLALANKESLIVGGTLVKDRAQPGQIAPVDSEHSALAQALRSGTPDEVSQLIVTASGGPFRGKTREELADVTPEQALQHPTWDMGLMVTTNSATLVNKALEVIEAHLLFDIPLDRVQAVVHPQSVIHSMVEFVDGSTLAQASPPDMRLPIALGLNWPRRVPGAAQACDWARPQEWAFEPLDHEAFPAISLAVRAQNSGPTHMAVYNAANEEAVHAFHAGTIGFLDIVDTIAAVLEAYAPETVIGTGPVTIDSVLSAERWARAAARARWESAGDPGHAHTEAKHLPDAAASGTAGPSPVVGEQ